MNKKTISKRSGNLWKLIGLLAILSSAPLAVAPKSAALDSTAVAKVSEPGRYSGYSERLYQGSDFQTTYVTMRDGVKIAVDYYLPKGLPENTKIPAVLVQTRYWRNMVVNLADKNTGNYLVGFGYAVICIDVRGTGASFGEWSYPWAPAEVADGAEVVDWIIKQPWSNGLVGTYGTSYMGSTGEFLLTNKHPAVKAAVIQYALYDAYTDVAYPGGIRSDWFLKTWAEVNKNLDDNDAGAMAKLMGIIPFDMPGIPGVRPVFKGGKGKRMLKQARLERAKNGNVDIESRNINFRDEYSKNWGGSIEKISPYSYKADVEASGAAIYSYSGWYDGPYTAATVNRYLNISNKKKLILGPWPHGGGENISPFAASRKNDYDHRHELLRFFDYHLKGVKNGLMEEPPVHYYTMGEEKWKSSDVWPPPSERVTYYFSAGNSLATEAPSAADGFDAYTIDYTASTGDASRYNALINLKRVPIGYPNRAVADKKLLVYETAPLENDIEVTGHPVVKLYVSTTATDGQFFVYLEDVAPDGKVSYITEGLLRAQCRALSNEPEPYNRPAGLPYHTFKKADAKPMIPGEIELITFDLQPTSALFKNGHKIRVAVAGADIDHFAAIGAPGTQIKVYRNATRLSGIDLPVVTRKK